MSVLADGAGRGSGPASQEWRGVAYGLVWALGAWCSQFVGIWLALGTTAALLCLTVLVLEGRTVLGPWPHSRTWLIGFPAGLLMAGGTVLLFGPVASAFPGLPEDVERLYATVRAPGLPVTLLVIPLVVTCEEIVWRGAVYEALRLRLPWVPAVLVGTAAYALAHVPIGSPALVLSAMGAGLCWNLLRARTDSLAAALVAHLVWDFAVLMVFDVTVVG
jgi:membrane protease YdiL (CAAX protease family)